MYLFTAAVLRMDFCVVNRKGVIPLASIGNLEEFPIYRNLSVLQFDVVNPNHHNSPYPVSVIIQLRTCVSMFGLTVDIHCKLYISKQFYYYC